MPKKKEEPMPLPKVDHLNEYELGLVEHQCQGIKDLNGYLLMKKTEWDAMIRTPLNNKTTRFGLAEDGDGKEYALIGNEYIPIECFKQDKNYDDGT